MSEPTVEYEHPAFIRAKALPVGVRECFPHSVEEAREWKAHISYHAIASNVLVAARTRIECAWAAYVDAVPGYDHDQEWQAVLDHGSKLSEHVARAMFPQFKDVPYAY